MGKKEAYKQKIEAELELAQAKLAEFKAQAKISTADARIKSAKQVDELEQMIGVTKAKLKELGEASEDAWEQLKDGVESAWGALSVAIRNAAAKFKD
jgi:cob(I)alamin adenosyltransferase